ncbi:MAG: DUF1194 domain-containing protein [Hyphomicrobiales bacterium]|nr:DUF1194 domain-containing protein [Hyphomicrobiales bacterium]
MRASPILPVFLLLVAAVIAVSAGAQPDARSHAQAGRQTEVDLELVLAVDISRSMDIDEQALQRAGYVAAFRHPEVIAAIGSGLIGRIAVTYLEWAGPATQLHVVPWTLVEDTQSAHAFADAMAAAPISRERHTSISTGLITAASLLAASPFAGLREVIDVSGDGPNNIGPPVLDARQAVLERGVTINGLPIMLRPGGGFFNVHDLDVYYENCVIGGPAAFLVTVESPDRFAVAIRRKLVLEIAGGTPRVIPAAAIKIQGDYDCLIGEKLRRRRMQEWDWE